MKRLLEHSKLLKQLKGYAQKEKLSIDEVKKEAEKYLKELYTVKHPLTHALALQGAEYVVFRAYEELIDVRHEELKNLAKILRRNSVAFVMTHKTYIDMFVLAIVLAQYGLPVPHVFAGINMAFWGLGDLGRKAGAIFIRRSFKDNELYKIILRFFIASLVDDKEQFMWALEGTRSRTGKLVWPKMGILKYIQEAEQQSKQDVKYIPVSIVYDLIPDVVDMTKEGRGFDKSPESLMWFLSYVRKMGKDFGKISIRFGEPVELEEESKSELPISIPGAASSLPKFAFELVHSINRVTPVTTTSLIFASLLSNFALSKKGIEHMVIELMKIIENHKSDALVDRGTSIGQGVQKSLNILLKSGLLQKVNDGTQTKYSVVPEHYINASYYANMAVHHLYHRAFIELALLSIQYVKTNRSRAFWKVIMELRDLFKFEFFYSNKASFSDEIERDLQLFLPEWKTVLDDSNFDIKKHLKAQSIIIAPVVLNTYLEAYRVVAIALSKVDSNRLYTDEQLLRTCLFIGEELHWKGKIHRIDSVSKPFVENGIRLAKNKGLVEAAYQGDSKSIQDFLLKINGISNHLKFLIEEHEWDRSVLQLPLPIDRSIVPGSKTRSITEDILAGEKGPHIGAFFDLDRTLIDGFSAKQFFQTRLLSGKMSPKEIIFQFNGALVYAFGNKNFAGLAAIGAKGVKGVKEKVFLDVGEEVYLKHLAKAIFPESRAQVDAHLAMGHTVAIISAATPYQVNPVARDLGVKHIMCTRMELNNGMFTGNIVEPACWGEGKAMAAESLVEEHNLDLSRSYFYTDSAEDLPLLDIVGNPRAVNPDRELSAIAFERSWPIYRFSNAPRPGVSNALRTVLAVGSLLPATLAGVASGAMTGSWRDGANSMMAVVGDLGTKLAGIKVVAKGKENMWSHRPAVFIFNHQSNVDLLITAKLLRKDAVGIAKKELQNTPLGPILKMGGVVFIDRKNKEKAIDALKPAVEALQNGISVAIAPEGTRSYDYKLGQFKKGAFHMAMQAGVPVVPIIIKNAHDAMPRGTNLITPSVVKVVIAKPIETLDWTKSNLDQKIEEVREVFLEELGQSETILQKEDYKKKGKRKVPTTDG